MTNTALLNENESASLTGISLATLLRFADAGYLKVQQEKEGQRYFARDELCRLFGIKTENFPEKTSTPLSGQIDCIKEPETSTTSEVGVACAQSAQLHSTFKTDAVKKDAVNEDSVEEDHLKDDIEESTLEVAEKDSEEESYTLEPVATPADEIIEDVVPEEAREAKPLPAKESLEDPSLTILRSVVDLQEQLLDEREEKISSLKEEVSWLRTRVERLEEKANRDQLLLLSETQTISRMIARDQKKSSLQLLLEWAGVAKKESPLQQTAAIEVIQKEK